MKNLIKMLGVAAVMVLPMAATAAHAGPSTDALSACLVKSTTADDHIALVDWIFTMIARHPSVASMVTISDAPPRPSRPTRTTAPARLKAPFRRLGPLP